MRVGDVDLPFYYLKIVKILKSYSGKGLQDWFDAMGLKICLDGVFMRSLFDQVDQVCDNIYNDVQRHLIKRILKELNGLVDLIGDATFSQRGRNSQDQGFTDRSGD